MVTVRLHRACVVTIDGEDRSTGDVFESDEDVLTDFPGYFVVIDDETPEDASEPVSEDA